MSVISISIDLLVPGLPCSNYPSTLQLEWFFKNNIWLCYSHVQNPSMTPSSLRIKSEHSMVLQTRLPDNGWHLSSAHLCQALFSVLTHVSAHRMHTDGAPVTTPVLQLRKPRRRRVSPLPEITQQSSALGPQSWSLSTYNVPETAWGIGDIAAIKIVPSLLP